MVGIRCGAGVCYDEAVTLLINGRFINKASESYLSATLSTTERHFGFKTKEMSLVKHIETYFGSDRSSRSSNVFPFVTSVIVLLD